MGLKNIDKIKYLVKFYVNWRRGDGCKPRLLRLLVTSKCNARCMMCNIWKLTQTKPDVTNDELNTQNWLDILKECSDMGAESVFISGGEPLLREDIVDIIIYAKGRGLSVEMVTNGLVMTEAKAEGLVQSGLDIIDFSIDGHTAEIHEQFRRVKGSWEKTKEAIGFIRQAKDSLGIRKPLIQVSYPVSKINYQYIGKMVDLKSEVGYDLLHFNPIIGKTTGVHPLFLTDRDLTDLESQLYYLRDRFRSAGMPISPLSDLVKMCSDREGAKEGRYAQSFIKKVLCFAPWEETTIDPFGNVYPCSYACPFQNLSDDLEHSYYGEEDYCMGNVKKDNFHQIWNGARYKKFREKLREFPSFPMCAWCHEGTINDAILTGFFKKRSLLFRIITSKIRQRFKKSEDLECEFLYK